MLLPHLLPRGGRARAREHRRGHAAGIDGVCVISHGSSNAVAMVNAVRVAYECATHGLVDHVAAAVRPRQGDDKHPAQSV